jgi:hypothetical protein
MQTLNTVLYVLYHVFSYRQFCVRLAASTAVAPGGPAERHPSFCSSACISHLAMRTRHGMLASLLPCFLASLPPCLLDGTEDGPAPARTTVMGPQAQGTTVAIHTVVHIVDIEVVGSSFSLVMPPSCLLRLRSLFSLFSLLSNGRLAPSEKNGSAVV